MKAIPSGNLKDAHHIPASIRPGVPSAIRMLLKERLISFEQSTGASAEKSIKTLEKVPFHLNSGKQIETLNTPTSQHLNVKITRDIKSSTSWHQAFALFVRNSEVFNHINLSALVNQIAFLVQEDRYRGRLISETETQDLKACISELQEFAEQDLHRLGQRELINVLHGLSKLGCLSRRFVQLAIPRVQLHNLKHQELTSLLWSLAHSRHKPPDNRWWAAVMQQLHIRLAHLRHQELATCAWSLASLHVHPGESLLSAVADQAVQRAAFLRQADLSNIFWALANLGYQPATPSLLSPLYAACADQACSMSPKNVSLILWAVSVSGWQVPPAWPGHLCQALSIHLPEEPQQAQHSAPIQHHPASYNTGSVDAVRTGVAMPPGMSQDCSDDGVGTSHHMQSSSGSDNVGRRSQALQFSQSETVHDSPFHAHEYQQDGIALEAATSATASSGGNEEEDVDVAAGVGSDHEDDWLRGSDMEEAADTAPQCDLSMHGMYVVAPRHAALTLHAMAKLGTRVDAQLAHRLADVVLHHAWKCDVVDIAMTVWAMGKLGHQLPEHHLAATFAVTTVRHSEMQPLQWCSLAGGLARHPGCQPPDTWIKAVCKSMLQSPGSWRPHETSNVLWSLAKMGLKLPGRLLLLLLHNLTYPGSEYPPMYVESQHRRRTASTSVTQPQHGAQGAPANESHSTQHSVDTNRLSNGSDGACKVQSDQARIPTYRWDSTAVAEAYQVHQSLSRHHDVSQGLSANAALASKGRQRGAHVHNHAQPSRQGLQPQNVATALWAISRLVSDEQRPLFTSVNHGWLRALEMIMLTSWQQAQQRQMTSGTADPHKHTSAAGCEATDTIKAPSLLATLQYSPDECSPSDVCASHDDDSSGAAHAGVSADNAGTALNQITANVGWRVDELILVMEGFVALGHKPTREWRHAHMACIRRQWSKINTHHQARLVTLYRSMYGHDAMQMVNIRSNNVLWFVTPPERTEFRRGKQSRLVSGK